MMRQTGTHRPHLHSHINVVGVCLVLNYPRPSSVALHHLPHGVVVVVVDIHPGLGTQPGVPHPMEPVVSARSLLVRSSYDGSGAP